jgi:TRAP-type C4-dicarboxylate transport system substrate-binding protein
MKFLSATIAAVAAAGFAFTAQADITLHGASQFNDEHPFNVALLKFQDEVTKNWTKEKINFVLHRNSELGLEKDYVAYMNQGISVDYAVFSPSHASTFSKMVAIMDMPFLFRDIDHWEKVLSSPAAMKPAFDDVYKKADIVMIGYAGGGTRHLIVNKPVTNMAELKGLAIRVMGAPIQTKIFQAIGAAPTVIAYSEVYNAIQTGVIQAAENEAFGLEAMKFYEVGPHIGMTAHAITIRPLGFAGKTFRKLPKDLQEVIMKAGAIGGKAGRDMEAGQSAQKLEDMQKKGWLKLHPFTERDKLLALAAPIRKAFAEEVGGTEYLNAVDSIK